MTREQLERLTKLQLTAVAKGRGISGRSTMTKAQLVEALLGVTPDEPPQSTPGLRLPGIGPEDRAQANIRRRTLLRRLAAMVDRALPCLWTSIDGHPCGLPCVSGSDRCVLHGGIDVFDIAVPATGRLGFESWPTLARHVYLATYDVDPIGLDPVVAEMVWHVLNGLYFDYFRVEVEGIEHVPLEGPAVLVANHGGAFLPYDAAMLALAVLNEAPLPRRVRVVGTEIFNMLPWVSHLYRKAGAAYAAREDAEHLLAHGRLLGIFPEGERGFMKPVWQAYQVQRFGRGGFVDLAERAGAPIVPVAMVGAEEVHPAVMVSTRLAAMLKMVLPEQRVDQIAVFLNPLPLPVRWHIRFLPALPPEHPGEPSEPLRMLERTEEVRDEIQHALDEMLVGRRTTF